MEDLRRQVLQGSSGGKTISRKAKARLAQGSSRNSSRAGSRANSRPVSRQGSDEGSAGTDDDEENSAASKMKRQLAMISDRLAAGDLLDDDEMDLEYSEEFETEFIKGNIKSIVFNKGRDTAVRLAKLQYYINTLSFKYALTYDILLEHHSALINAFLKRIKSDRDERETIRTLYALSLTIISAPHAAIYEAVAPRLRSFTSQTQSHQAKAAAIHCLGTSTFFGGASEEEIASTMDFLLSIIQSDGNAIGSADNGDIVIAALEEWSFLATCRDDIELDSDDAMDAFLEQLDSSDTQVQIAAGENIALAVERSFSEVEEGEDGSKAIRAPNGRKLLQRYQPFGRMYLVEEKVTELANISSKWVSKKDKRALHKNFTDILNAVENPTSGPRFSNAIDQETDRVYGSRLTLQLGGDNKIQVDSWEKFMKLKALRRSLGGALLDHYRENKVLMDTVAFTISDDDDSEE